MVNYSMKNTKLLIVVFGVVVLIVVGFFVYNTFLNKENQESSKNQIKVVKIEDLSTIILSVNDFPTGENWTLKDRIERGKSDVSDEGLALGWKRGYQASYLRGNLEFGNLDYSRLDMYISEYPPENISLAFLNPSEDNGTIYDSLSNLKIGDSSRAYKAIYIDEFGTEDYYYIVEFTKMNVYERLDLSGTRVDYELLKELAKKAEAKI